MIVRQRNGIGEEYTVKYEVLQIISDRDGVRVIVGRERGRMPEVLVVNDDDFQVFACGPADRAGRERALYYADGYRVGLTDGLERQ
jgi:hypothetical protein